MPFKYAVKHVFRSWHLFIALLIGIILATAFFAGIDTKANVTTQQVLNQQLTTVYKDMEINAAPFNLTQLNTIEAQLSLNQKVKEFEVISSASVNAAYNDTSTNETIQLYPSIVGITDNSKVYDGWTNKPIEGLGENETYIVENVWSKNMPNTPQVGDVIQVNFTRIENNSMVIMPLNLTVAGFAQLDDEANSILNSYSVFLPPFGSGPVGLSGQSSIITLPGQETLIVNWDKTVKPFLNIPNATTFQQSIIIYANRGSLISAWDIPTSISNVQVLQNDITNNLDSALSMQVTVQNYLVNTLQSFTFYSNTLWLDFILVSIPIFFIAWYMGTTVSDVSFNTRRREIGLLSTKGFSNGQISRIFLLETLLIGLIGSLIGVVIGYLLTPLITQLPMADAYNLQKINPWTIIFTVAFGLIMAFMSTFWSARKAANLSTAGAIKEYLPLEPQKPFRNKLAWAAFILGTYKIAIFISGVNLSVVLSHAMYSGSNFFLTLLGGIWLVADGILSYIGPVLFLWGFAKLFIQGSVKFQELTTRASRFLGDIGRVATKNVRRKPGRSAAIAFLIALIVAYSIMVTGQLASEKDYEIRNTYYNVGADVTATIANVSQSQNIVNYIVANISGVKSATVEYTMYSQDSQQNSMTLKAVDPQVYLKTAYYEPSWFSGISVEKAFADLAADNNTIILDRGVAKSMSITLGKEIAVSFQNPNGTITKSLRVVGFYGSDSTDQSTGIVGIFGSQYGSFVPTGFYQELASNITDANAIALIKLNSGANGTDVSKNIMNANLMVSSTDSFDQEWRASQTNVMTIGPLEVQQLGIVFAVLAASVGTALISVVSMRERNREATIMSVKGLSYRQLAVMFLTENVAVITFATVLGVFTGLVVVYGNIASSNAMATSLVTRHFLFPLSSSLTIAAFVVLIFASTIIPIIIMARKYVTNLERMVRLR
ncbi:MAG: FtsX-like permease family protein [Candidatus Bathyarchaeia archaeon]|jgi:ABC-type lipoprotein release transport system permease subunit